MQYELRQRIIEPRRKTFQHVIDRLGDRPASRYEEGTLDVQPTENFHYRPLWDPEHELYDPTYSALRLTDPYRFKDPRQFYYAPYVTARAAMHDAFGKSLSYIEQRQLLASLPTGWQELLTTVVLPLRHFESGAQLISVAGARFAYGTSVEQCLSYAAFDRIGNAQMISRVGINLADGTDDLLAVARESWMEAEALQPLRRAVELLLVEKDWAVASVGLDLLDRFLYPLLYRHLDEVALLNGAGTYSLIAQHFAAWYDDNRRWVDALLACWVQDETHGPDNLGHLQEAVAVWKPLACDAARAVAVATDAKVPGARSGEFVAELDQRMRRDLGELGIRTGACS